MFSTLLTIFAQRMTKLVSVRSMNKWMNDLTLWIHLNDVFIFSYLQSFLNASRFIFSLFSLSGYQPTRHSLNAKLSVVTKYHSWTPKLAVTLPYQVLNIECFLNQIISHPCCSLILAVTKKYVPRMKHWPPWEREQTLMSQRILELKESRETILTSPLTL